MEKTGYQKHRVFQEKKRIRGCEYLREEKKGSICRGQRTDNWQTDQNVLPGHPLYSPD